MDRYRYSSLGEKAGRIRFLTLLPGKFSAPIGTAISETPLTEDYTLLHCEVLSYAWGKAADKFNATVGFFWRRVAVTRNLACALRHLRRLAKPQSLWIDAICIDQQSLKERANQVQMMAEVYNLVD